MAPLPCYRYGEHDVVFEDGSLFSLVPELKVRAQVESYRAARLGWSLCPLGYSIYKVALASGHVAFPGIHVVDGPSPRRRFPNYTMKFTKRQVESVARELVVLSETVDSETAKLVANLTHDLRALSAQIYNAAEMVKNHLGNQSYWQASNKADTVIAAQQMLSLRLDMLDYSSGLALERDPERIPVYKKFDKVVKCFEPSAQVSEVKIDLQGPSSGFTYGAPVFELVPFVLVENAVKYSPRRGIITVKVSDFDNYIMAHVRSWGPRITNAESLRLFEQGFRAEAARSTGKSGSGVGLFAAHSLLKGSFQGELIVSQDNVPVNFDGTDMWTTTFSCKVPRVA